MEKGRSQEISRYKKRDRRIWEMGGSDAPVPAFRAQAL